MHDLLGSVSSVAEDEDSQEPKGKKKCRPCFMKSVSNSVLSLEHHWDFYKKNHFTAGHLRQFKSPMYGRK